MRKIILFSLTLLFLPLSVQAVYYSPDKATILGMHFAWDGANTTSGPIAVIDEGAAVRFSAEMQYGNGNSDGWASMGIGYPWPTPPPVSDLSGYTGIVLNFLNTNNSAWFVNLYMNTGWTDPPYGETNHFYQDGWVELLPGVSTTIALDFSAVGAINLNHVTNFGFQVGANMDEYPFWNPNNPSNHDAYHVDVWTVPEPVTIMLLGLGSLALRRRR